MTYGFLANVPADIKITARGGRVQIALAGVPVKFPPSVAYAIADELVTAAESAEGRSATTGTDIQSSPLAEAAEGRGE